MIIVDNAIAFIKILAASNLSSNNINTYVSTIKVKLILICLINVGCIGRSPSCLGCAVAPPLKGSSTRLCYSWHSTGSSVLKKMPQMTRLERVNP